MKPIIARSAADGPQCAYSADAPFVLGRLKHAIFHPPCIRHHIDNLQANEIPETLLSRPRRFSQWLSQPPALTVFLVIFSLALILPSVGFASVSSGDQDYAMDFNGTSQYAAATTRVIPTSGAFTVSAWVFDDTANDGFYQEILSQGSPNGPAFYLGTTPNSQELRAGDTWFKTGVDLPAGQWAHVALVADGSGGAVLYLNGQQAATKGSGFSAPADSGTAFRVGRQHTNNGEYWEGQVDQVKIYNVALDAAAIASDMHAYGMYTDDSVTSVNHLGFYDFNEGPAGTTGTGTVYNRVASPAAGTNLGTVNSPTYTDVKQTTSNGDNTVITFPRSYLTAAGGWRVPEGVASAQTLVVAGGGAGGYDGGGGGGGGGVVPEDEWEPSSEGAIASVVVGMGGLAKRGYDPPGCAGAHSSEAVGCNGLNGGDSTFDSISVSGGGGGGGIAANGSNAAAGTYRGAGGGGGGGSRNAKTGVTTSGGTGASVGGTTSSGTRGSGGGGSRGGPDGNGVDGADAEEKGRGGPGTSSSITGTELIYGGGGGGGNYDNTDSSTGVAIAVPGAGAGGNGNSDGGDAAANRGGGGGGSGNSSTKRGGNGGSGVVIVSYVSSCSPTESQYTDGATTYKVLTFTDTGSCTWTVPNGVNELDILVVGGGGGGGSDGGGGGGGGGVRYDSAVAVSDGTEVSLTVGAGGAGGSFIGGNTLGSAGTSSSVSWTGRNYMATGGAGGNGFPSTDQASAGTSSGDGSAGSAGAGGEGAGTCAADKIDQGTDGNSGFTSGFSGATIGYAGGGGGGSASETIPLTFVSPVPLTLTSAVDGGGSGAAVDSGTVGETSGNFFTSGSDGVRGGGGGGGAACGPQDYNNRTLGSRTDGGNGGDGVVIIRYEISDPPVCTPLTYPSGDYTVVEFQGAGECTWTVPSNVTKVDVLAVGGGGGGGAWVGGGGGGGGVTDTSVTTPSGVTVTPGSQISVTVGAGGSGAIKTSNGSLTNGTNGGTSTFGASSPVTALGGGVGASWTDQTAGTGSNVVATGGGGSQTTGSTGERGTGQTSNGGAASMDDQPHPAGGGGGAGGNGNAGTGTDCGVGVGGAGGPGVSSSLAGSAVHYGGGGGGGVHGAFEAHCGSNIWGTSGAGGIGGGATGASATSDDDEPIAASGTDGLGGGGGGAATVYAAAPFNNTSQGGDGGNGVVIVRFDVTAPTVSSVSVPSDGSYKATDTLSFTVNTSEPVTVVTSSGTPRMELTIGGSTAYAEYASGSGSSALVFNYTVQAGDTDSDGIVIGALSANGGTLKDAAGNDLNLTLNNVESTAGVLIDTTAPTLSIQNVPSIVNSTDAFSVTFEFSEDVTGFALGDITVVNGAASNFMATDGNTYTADITPDGNGDITIDVMANVAQDAAGNGNTAAVQVSVGFTASGPPVFTSTQGNVTLDIGDSFSYSVRATDPTNDPITFSTNGDLASWLSFESDPVEVAFAGTGIFPANNGGIYDSPDGTVATEANLNIMAYGLSAVDGKVFFGDSEEFGIRYVDENGLIQTLLAGDGSFRTLQAAGIVHDPDSNTTYFGHYSGHKVFKLVDGGEKEEIATGISFFVMGMALDKANNKLYASARNAIYEIDLSDNSTRRIIGSGNFFGSYLDTGMASTSEVNQPHGLTFDAQGRLVFADRSNDIIRRIDIARDTVETIAGIQGTSAISGNGGPATSATFADPTGIAIDSQGRIFITERLARVVRMISADGTIDEFASVRSVGFLNSLTIDEDGELFIGGSRKIAQVDTNTKLFGTTSCDDVGVHSVTITATDDSGLSAIQSFSITVVDGSGQCTDSDSDGIPDVEDQDTIGDLDTDGDGTPDYLDNDDDNDGIADSVEGFADDDSDTIVNARDDDSDGDGVNDSQDEDSIGFRDSDGDEIPDYIDTDDDNDGITDSVEGVGDSDNDGIPNAQDTDADNDGIPDWLEGATDSDGDGAPDYLDTDSDNDGTLDANEGSGDSNADGTPDYKDANTIGDPAIISEAGAAVTKIQSYAADSGANPAPTAADYLAAGVTGVTEANLAQINDSIAEQTAAQLATPASIQELVNETVDLTVITDYVADPINNPAPTVADYAAAGVVGVTEENLSAINEALAEQDSGDVNTLEAIQDLADSVIASAPLRVPTLPGTLLGLLALVMAGLGWRRLV